MARNRAGSRLSSFRKSSSSSVPRTEEKESSQEKHRYQVKGKTDPSSALRELQPADIAGEGTTMGTPLRALEHRDTYGNVIVDADRSNPTRPRLERPLDTIRSFEAAIDGSYNRRQSYIAETPNIASQPSRRNSYFNGSQWQRRGPTENGGFQNDRIGNGRPDSYYENGAFPPTPYNGGHSRRFGPRTHSDPALYGNNHNTAVQQNPYSSHGQQPSYDTVGTASNGSHFTEPWGNSTDPSSENSSIDRVQPGPKTDAGDAYGFNGFGGGPQFQGPILEEYGHGGPSYGQPGYGTSQVGNTNGHPYQGNGATPNSLSSGAPLPPPKESAPPRVPIKLGANNHAKQASDVNAATVPENEKRRSWLKRRFSKG